MPYLPLPYRCIWCQKAAPQVTFKSESHIMMAAAGNDSAILPPGIVCDDCNNHFAKDVEPELLSDPLFRVQTWAVRTVNTRTKKLFCAQLLDDGGNEVPLPPLPLSEGKLHLYLDLTTGNSVRMTITNTTATGTTTATLSKAYPPLRLAFLSRAIHKIAFESFALAMYAGQGLRPEHVVDPHSAIFDAVRAWGRYGQPGNSTRPFIQLLNFRGATPVPTHFGPEVHLHRGNTICRYIDGAIWYAVSLTSPPPSVLDDLKAWAGDRGLTEILCVSERFARLRIAP